MDSDLRTLLREKADEVRIVPRIPPGVLRRSRHRRLANGALAAGVTAALVSGVVVISRAMMAERTAPRLGPGAAATPPNEAYPFIYPTTQEELYNTAAEVAQGSMPMWTDPRGAAILFAVNVLGWDMDDTEAEVRGDQPITAIITNPALNAAAGTSADIRTAVSLLRVPGQHDPPMYAVLAAQAEDMELEPVGPDEQFGAGGTVAFRGRLRSPPDGATVVLTVDGGRGVPASPGPEGRFEVEAPVLGGVGPSTLLSVALVDSAGRTLALTSSRVATPAAGKSEAGASAPVQVSPPREIPRSVVATRAAILDAAQAYDWNAIRALIPDQGFTFSYGGGRDPIAYWQQLESEGHVPVIGDILPAVLNTEPGRLRGVYIWPAQAAEDPQEWDEHDLEVLRQIHAEEDIRLFQEIDLYTGWRIGIDRNGTWVFFVSGD